MPFIEGKEAVGSIVTSLVNYTETHFKIEEDYFVEFNYLDAKSHKMEHAEFVKKVSDFKNGYDKGTLSLSIEIMNFLSSWLQDHIKGTDKKYTALFKEKGMK